MSGVPRMTMAALKGLAVEEGCMLEIELAAKTAECERLRESQREIAAALGVPGCDAAEMLNVIDSIREDAGRYRWLRCSPGGTMRDWLYMPHTEELDAAIDAARKETP